MGKAGASLRPAGERWTLLWDSVPPSDRDRDRDRAGLPDPTSPTVTPPGCGWASVGITRSSCYRMSDRLVSGLVAHQGCGSGIAGLVP